MPSIFKKTYCQRCDKEVPLFGGQKIADGYICSACKKFLQPHLDEHNISFTELTVEMIQQIDEEIRIKEELRKQKERENTKKSIKYALIAFAVLLVIGAFSNLVEKKEPPVPAVETEAVEEEPEKVEVAEEKLEKEQFSKETVHHILIQRIPTSLSKDITDGTYTWHLDDKNYIQAVSHEDIISYYSTVADDFQKMCTIIQEQDGITISDSQISATDKDHYIYYGEKTIDNIPYHIAGHIYATRSGMDEVRLFTTEPYADSVYKNVFDSIIDSIVIASTYKMDPAPKEIIDGLDDMQSFFVAIYSLTQEKDIRTMASTYGFYFKELVSDETFAKWLIITRETIPDITNTIQIDDIERVIVFIDGDGEMNSMQYTNGQEGESKISCHYYVYGDKVPVADVMNDLIDQNNK